MITRADLDALLDGFGTEMVNAAECEARDRVLGEFYADPDAHGWVPVRTIEGEVVDGR